MGFEYHWRTMQGQQRDDNWDYFGLGLRPDASLSIVLDGSTSGEKSGELVRLIAIRLIDCFCEAQEVAEAPAIIDQLRKIHKELAPMFPSASASYVIILMKIEKSTVILHAGDCLAGLCNGKTTIDWHTQPHTLVNPINDIPIAEIAQSSLRNRLTRSFRMREFLCPEICEIPLPYDGLIIAATDGFWADITPEEQNQVLSAECRQKIDFKDDCSVLTIRTLITPDDCIISGQNDENTYYRGL